MDNKQLEELVELLLPYIKKKLKEDNDFKLNVKRKNATVVSVTDDNVEVRLPYDNVTFTVPNETGQTLSAGNLVCIEYCIDLKNAVAVYKL